MRECGGFPMTLIYNRHQDLEKRRSLRQRAPATERIVWARLRDRRLGSLKFRRQYSLGPYVLDFYCPALKLALEADGLSHESADAREYDAERQRYMEALGVRFFRFTNAAARENLDGILQSIAEYAQQLSEQSSPLLTKERG